MTIEKADPDIEKTDPDKISLYERRLYHRALWVWCGENYKHKSEWPGWEIFTKKPRNSCFMCPTDKVYCTSGFAKLCSGDSYDCLGGLHTLYIRAEEALDANPTSWTLQRAYELACYRIAYVELRETRYNRSFNKYKKVLANLYPVCGHVRFVPVNDKDRLRFRVKCGFV